MESASEVKPQGTIVARTTDGRPIRVECVTSPFDEPYGSWAERAYIGDREG